MSTALYSYPDVFPVTQDLSAVVAGTSGSVGVIVGASDRGPVNTRTPITSTRVLTNIFGAPNISTSYLHHSVLVAMEAMSLVYVTRVVGTGAAMSAIGIGHTTSYTNTFTAGVVFPFVSDEALFTADSTTALVFMAANPGTWGNNLSIYIDNVVASTNSAPDSFNVTVYENVAGQNIVREKWSNLSTSRLVPGTTRPNLDGYGRSSYVEDVINNRSSYISVAANLNAANPTPTATLAVATLTTSASTSSGSPTLTFTSTAGTKVGQIIVATNVPAGTTVVSFNSTTITMSANATGTVASGATITLTSPGSPIALVGGATGSSVTEAQVAAGWHLYSDRNTIGIDILINGGYVTSSTFGVQAAMDSLASTRQDCFAILDIPYDQQVVTQATSWRKVTQNFNSSFSALYTGWPLCWDSINDIHQVPMPVSGFAAQVFARRDYNKGATWYAPAGLQDGLISSGLLPVEGLSVYYDEPSQSILYEAGINFVRMFIGGGYAIWGQKTLQFQRSALDRINVRRLIIAMNTAIRRFLLTQVFELNNTFTRQLITSTVTQFMQSIQARNGVYAFGVLCDTTNNSNQDVDNNTLNIEIRIQPQKTAEIIVFTTTIERTGSNLSVTSNTPASL